MIVYLHGFKSSPQSFKARLLGDVLDARGRANEYVCPQLPASPTAAIMLAMTLVGTVPPDELTLIGSSLGGYYATWMAERIGCRAVLLNPAIQAADKLGGQVGIGTAYHSEQPFEFKTTYIDELRALQVPLITQPQRYFLIAATGDEVLDWREMQAYYAGASQRIIDGSDHGLSDFASHVDAVLGFCDLPAS